MNKLPVLYTLLIYIVNTLWTIRFMKEQLFQ